MQEVRCPRCGETHRAAVHDTLDVARHPALKGELLSSRLFQHACPSCGGTWHASRTLLYQDLSQELLLWLYPGEKTDEARRRLTSALDAAVGAQRRAACTMRLVGNPHDLIEKVLIFDAGLSDMMIELLKVTVSGLAPAAHGADLRFSPTQPRLLAGAALPFAILRPGEKVARMDVPWAHYEMVSARFPGLLIAAESSKGSLLTVDQAFALDALRPEGAAPPLARKGHS